MLVLPGADLDLAADATVNAGSRFCRRRCGDLPPSSRSKPVAAT